VKTSRPAVKYSGVTLVLVNKPLFLTSLHQSDCLTTPMIWFSLVHQRASVRISDGCSPVGCMCRRSQSMDGVQQTDIKCREDSANLDKNWATASQADRHSTPADKISCWVWQYGHEPRRGSWRSAVHVSEGYCCLSLMFLPATSAEVSQELLD